MFQCLATVVSNSPYQKLRPGLLSRTVKLVRPYLAHRGKIKNLLSEIWWQLKMSRATIRILSMVCDS